MSALSISLYIYKFLESKKDCDINYSKFLLYLDTIMNRFRGHEYTVRIERLRIERLIY